MFEKINFWAEVSFLMKLQGFSFLPAISFKWLFLKEKALPKN